MLDVGREMLAAQPSSELLGAELTGFEPGSETLCGPRCATIRTVRDPDDSATR